MLEKTLESPLDCKEIRPGCLLEGLILKLKLRSFGHLMRRVDSFEKTLMLGKIEGRRRRGRQDEMVGWHHQFSGRGFGWTLGVGDGQGGLACCGPWGHKESDMTEWLNWTGTTGSPHLKKRESRYRPDALYKNYVRMDDRPTHKMQTVKLLEDKTENLSDLRCGNGFSDTTQKTGPMK